MFATCATPSPIRKWYTRDDDDDDDVEEDGYQRFVQRGVDGIDGGSSGDIGKKVIRVGSHMLATKARCNANSNRTPGPALASLPARLELLLHLARWRDACAGVRVHDGNGISMASSLGKWLVNLGLGRVVRLEGRRRIGVGHR